MDKPIKRTYTSKVRERRAAQTRREILNAARSLFSEQGYAQTTIGEIAAKAEVSSQTIYNSVGGKPDVLLALSTMVDEIIGIGDAMESIATTDDAEEILRLLVSTRRRTVERVGDILENMVEAGASEPQIAEAYERRGEAGRARCAAVVERLESLGALRADYPQQEAADGLFTLLHHAIWHRLMDPCGWSPGAIEEWLVDVLCRTLLDR